MEMIKPPLDTCREDAGWPRRPTALQDSRYNDDDDSDIAASIHHHIVCISRILRRLEIREFSRILNQLTDFILHLF